MAHHSGVQRWGRLLKRGLFHRTAVNRSLSSTPHPRPNDANQQQQQPKFPGCAPGAAFTRELRLVEPSEQYEPMPIYTTTMNDDEPRLERETVERMYRTMTLGNVFDRIMYESQRQGRISFYMTNYGEEAMQVGSAAALSADDLVYAQYRELGVLLWRGMTLEQLANQCFGNCADAGKGKQMPVHYGDRALNIATISSPLGTQLPQAAGSAYAFKLQKDNKRCVICYFGEGAASEGDAHAAFNFASTLDCPVIFFCRNNGYAISTPASEQYRGDGVAARAAGYGVAAARVDGTDAFAVYGATRLAREYALAHNRPVIVEAMSYRVGHHSTSDDSTAYRRADEIGAWTTGTERDPIARLRRRLEARSWWSDAAEARWADEARREVVAAMAAAERRPKPDWREMFEDVYAETPGHLENQMAEMKEHLKKYGEHYPLSNFKEE